MSPNRCITIPAAALCFALGVIPGWSSPAMGQTAVESPLIYNTWESFSARDGLPHDGIRAIHIVDDDVWVGTEGGLALYHDGDWQRWTQDDGLGSTVVSAIDMDVHTGELWLGTWGGGLVRFSAGRFDRFQQFDSGLAGNLIFSVRVAGGRVWAATEAGLSSFNPVTDTWELYAARRIDTPETLITDLSADGDCLYAAGWGEVLRRLNLQQSEWVPVDGVAGEGQTGSAGLRRFEEAAIGIAAPGRSVWLLTRERLFRRHGTHGWEAHGVGSGCEAGNFNRCLAARSEAEAWVGTSDGLSGIVDWATNTWVTYRRCENGDGGLVTLTRQGRTVAVQSVASSIPDNRIRCVAFDQDTVWVGTVNGLAHGANRKRWSPLPARGDGAKANCPKSTTAASGAHKARGESSQPDAVTIAVLGSGARPIALPGGNPFKRGDKNQPDLSAIQLAMDEANAQGGYRGRVPFRLVWNVGAYLQYGWGTPESDFAKFRSEDHALGILAHVGSSYVVRSAVAFRSEIPIVNIAGSIPEIEEGTSSWVFRCSGDDPRQQQRVVDYISDHLGYTRFAILRTPGVTAHEHLNHWGRFARAWTASAGGTVVEVEYDPTTGDVSGMSESLRKSGADVVLTWADAAVSAGILRAMRDRGMTQLFVGGSEIVCDEFVKLAGSDAGAVIAMNPCPHRRDPEAVARFVEAYVSQNSPAQQVRLPDADAYRAYHAARHLLLAVNMAGPDREDVRYILAKMANVRLATLKSGKWESLSLPHR